MTNGPMASEEVADRIIDLVRATIAGEEGVETNDRNERLLCAAYGRAYRCFVSIRELTERGEADDALILARALLSIVLQSAYLVQADDSEERERRFRRAALTWAEKRKRLAEEMAAAGLDTGAPERFAEIARRLRADGVTALPDERAIAESLGLEHFYTRIYRTGSDVSHYSIGAMLDGFLELTQEDVIRVVRDHADRMAAGDAARYARVRGPVALEKPEPEKAEEVLMMAALTYGVFLDLSESVIPHGIGRTVRDLLAEHHTRRALDDGS